MGPAGPAARLQQWISDLTFGDPVGFLWVVFPILGLLALIALASWCAYLRWARRGGG